MSRGEGAVVLLATSNRGKLAEFARLLPASVRVLTLDDVGLASPPEDGTTFAENAAIKALAGAASGLPTFADDSGLVVDALGGRPGVRSARFGGEPNSDERNRTALLFALEDVAAPRRTARFVCAVALARTGTIVARAEGTCEGMIATAPRGTLGFGYDPLFLLPEGRTMAEVPPAEKDRVSHRGLAYRRLLPDLLRELGIDETKERLR